MFWVAMAHVRAMAAAICSDDDCPVSSVINISGSSPPPKKFRGRQRQLRLSHCVQLPQDALVAYKVTLAGYLTTSTIGLAA